MDKNESRTCKQCGGEMKQGKALQNTISYGMPDFEGSDDRIGQTFSFSGPAQMVSVDKCQNCGYSRTK